MVIKVAKVAGTAYNWIGFPITSQITVKQQHLVEVTHPKLSRKSYAKIMDPVNFKWDPDNMELAKEEFDANVVEEAIFKFTQFLHGKDVQRDTKSGVCKKNIPSRPRKKSS